MTDDTYKMDPQVEKAIEREYKISHYDDLRVHRAALVWAIVGFAAGLLWEAIRR